jgi:hypothetical protein
MGSQQDVFLLSLQPDKGFFPLKNKVNRVVEKAVPACLTGIYKRKKEANDFFSILYSQQCGPGSS